MSMIDESHRKAVVAIEFMPATIEAEDGRQIVRPVRLRKLCFTFFAMCTFSLHLLAFAVAYEASMRLSLTATHA